jgi:hypothetical protein
MNIFPVFLQFGTFILVVTSLYIGNLAQCPIPNIENLPFTQIQYSFRTIQVTDSNIDSTSLNAVYPPGTTADVGQTCFIFFLGELAMLLIAIPLFFRPQSNFKYVIFFMTLLFLMLGAGLATTMVGLAGDLKIFVSTLGAFFGGENKPPNSEETTTDDEEAPFLTGCTIGTSTGLVWGAVGLWVMFLIVWARRSSNST